MNKRYLKQRGDISIMASLKDLRDIKHEMSVRLVNLLRFVWRCYWKKKLKKKKKKKGKGKGKGKKKSVDSGLSQTMKPERKGSIMVPNKKADGTPSPNKTKVEVKGDGGTINLVSGDGGDDEFQRSQMELNKDDS